MTEYWTVWKVARFLGVSENTVRNYEKKGLIPKAERHQFSRYRFWRSEKIIKIRVIKETCKV